MTRVAWRSWAVAVKLLVWVVALGLVGLAGAESFLRLRSARERARLRQAAPHRARIEDGCREAGTSHLHPHYLFFLPFTAERRAAISTGVCGITPDGFRKPGPDQRGARRLAFLIGGSVAFSDMASSDEATITSALNRLQDAYFFVTAGVPGWNSSQELSRVAFQLLDYAPALVVALDGANDAALADRYAGRGDDWAGVPADFDLLAQMADRQTPLAALAGVRDALLPALTVRWRMQREAAEIAAHGPPTAADMQRGASRYITNLTRMRDLVAASGGRFVAVFQPMAQLHRKLDAPFIGVRQLDAFHSAAVQGAAAHGAAVTGAPAGLEFHDFARLFDGLLPVVHVNEGEVTPDTVFVDDVHLHDRGNALLAEALWTAIREGTQDAPPPGHR
ncbi:MAG: hypothetical protein AB7I25_08910 [Vicinamibacterales bacterium]